MKIKKNFFSYSFLNNIGTIIIGYKILELIMNKNSLLLQQMKLRLSDSNLNLKTEDEIERIIHQLKCRGKKESLDSILPEWFGIVQEVSRRKIGFKHFDSQLLAGLMLHQGKVIEMKTGEGKTLASTLPVSLNAFRFCNFINITSLLHYVSIRCCYLLLLFL